MQKHPIPLKSEQFAIGEVSEFFWCEVLVFFFLHVNNNKQAEPIFGQMLQRLKPVALQTEWVYREKGNCPDFRDSY